MIQQPFYVCGPTASGKTALALALARKVDGEIVNGDAFQVYRGLEILSATPSPEEMASSPHHLFGILDPEEAMDAAKYATLAEEIISEIQGRGKRPVIVGGSGLYLKFLTHGIADAPGADPALRAELEALPVEEVFARLQELDPEEAARQNSQNHRHLSRALEICLLTGGKASERRRNFENPKKLALLRGAVLVWPRDELAERIARRTAKMMEEGAVEEVAVLPPSAKTVRQAIGVREIEAFLAGEMTREEMQERITISTRQYAKRQRNWFRRESWLQEIDGRLPVADQVAALELGECSALKGRTFPFSSEPPSQARN